jgi:hypothetical protein
MNAAELSKLIASTATKPDNSGWFTSSGLAAELGVSKHTACGIIRQAAEMGLLIAERRITTNVLGERQSLPHYRLRTTGATNGKATQANKAKARR